MHKHRRENLLFFIDESRYVRYNAIYKREKILSSNRMKDAAKLSRREREIMEIVYAREGATVAEIHSALQDAPGRAAVRKLVQILEDKGHLKHTKAGREHTYHASQPKHSAARRALQGLLDTFFGGSLRDAVAAHLTGKARKLDEAELREIEKLVQQAREATGKEP